MTPELRRVGWTWTMSQGVSGQLLLRPWFRHILHQCCAEPCWRSGPCPLPPVCPTRRNLPIFGHGPANCYLSAALLSFIHVQYISEKRNLNLYSVIVYTTIRFIGKLFQSYIVVQRVAIMYAKGFKRFSSNNKSKISIYLNSTLVLSNQ